jgi:hypothetical protein
MFGQPIEGDGDHKLMENCEAICNEMEEHVVKASTRVAGTGEEIRHVGEMLRHLLHSLDGYFSSLRTKIFHLTAEFGRKKTAPQPSFGS